MRFFLGLFIGGLALLLLPAAFRSRLQEALIPDGGLGEEPGDAGTEPVIVPADDERKRASCPPGMLPIPALCLLPGPCPTICRPGKATPGGGVSVVVNQPGSSDGTVWIDDGFFFIQLPVWQGDLPPSRNR